MNHYRKAIECIECVQQNMNDKGFIDWLYEKLGLGLTEADK
tara:strand:+ start:176 stop:298 length:123 start_codon:yes stop_codon:yes gene_type:complete